MTNAVPLRKPAPRASGDTFVIVGAGQAGAQAAITLRENGFAGRVVLVGDEPHLPYMRPPLSKRFLAGEVPEERLYVRAPDYYARVGIELRVGARVESIDAGAGRVVLEGGEKLEYAKLLLATGTRARALAVAGGTHANVHYLRGLGDAMRLRASLVPGARIAVVGGGYVGLEVAATAVAAGARVTVLEAGERVLGRVATADISGFVAGVHRDNGVDIRCGARVASFEHATDGATVRFADGSPGLAFDLAVVGVGAMPNVELAAAAGLACDDGIVVDELCRTSAANIYAAGDCTRHPNALLGRRLRLESVQNAVDQAGVAALNMCGQVHAYARIPWFWSNQYGYKLQSAGIADGHDEVVEVGSRQEGRFALLYHRKGELIACDCVNMPGEYLSARRRIEGGAVALAASARQRAA